MSALQTFLTFKSPGPVASAFLADRTNMVRALRGPVGGGKTVTCIFDALMQASRMPLCLDGKIRFKLAVIGLTYGQLERNLLPTWRAWLPEGQWTDDEFTGGGGRHATHRMAFLVERGGRRVEVEFEAVFAAIGENAVELFMRGFEPTAFWLFEMDQLPEAVLPIAITRLGRFPRKVDLPAGTEFRAYVVGDLNSPDVDSWYYRTFEEALPHGFRQYAQPSGLSSQAENRQNLPKDYYERQVAALGNKPNLIKRFVLNEYAPSSDGQPVYPEYSDERHLAPGDLAPIKGLPLKLGIDAGLRSPAAVVYQRSSVGQYRVYAEIVPGRVSTKSFAALIRKTIGEVAPGHAIEVAYGDPAGFAGTVAEDNQLGFMDQLMAELGIPILPTENNELDLRLDAVRDELSASIDAHTPALLIARRCRVLRKGFASHYRYSARRVAGNVTLAPKPEKNDWSHVHDALQYALFGDKGRYGIVRGGRGERRGRERPTGSIALQNAVRLFE